MFQNATIGNFFALRNQVGPPNDLTLGNMAGLRESHAMGSIEALAIVVVFVLAAVVVTMLVQTPRR